ncbi:hemerythrin domain-containing protein [Azospirillum sp. sgz302134]
MHTDSRTGQLLHEDHHRVIDLLNALDACLDAWLEGRTDDGAVPVASAADRALLAALAKEFGEDLERHFALEEDALFPAIAAAGAYELTTDLAADHEALRPVARRFARLCTLVLRNDADGGFDEESWPLFQHFSRQLSEGLVLHIQKEETTLLAAIDAVLPPDQDMALAGAYR